MRGGMYQEKAIAYLLVLLLNHNRFWFHRAPLGRYCPYPENDSQGETSSELSIDKMGFYMLIR
jgi:hypothetical protein